MIVTIKDTAEITIDVLGPTTDEFTLVLFGSTYTISFCVR